MIRTILLILLVSCGTFGSKTGNPNPDKLALVQTKASLYKVLAQDQAEANGFIEFKNCDSLLFSGLYGIAVPVNLTVARSDSGQWFRRPIYLPACYMGGTDNSTISRDMLIGVMWYAWRNNRLDIAEDLFSYGTQRSWIMGDGDRTRTYFSPGLQATLAEIVYRLGGANNLFYRNLPQIIIENDGYAAHLNMLHILLRGELTGSITEGMMDVVVYNYKRVPGNALYSFIYHKFADGNQNETLDHLLNTKIFPADRLPTTDDRCEPWIYQRDLGKDWEPCDDNLTHSGGDLIFVAKLIGG